MCIARDEKKPPEFSLYKAVKQAERGAPALLGSGRSGGASPTRKIIFDQRNRDVF